MGNVQSGPLVVDTRGWGRQPGNERTVDLSVQAPKGLGHDVYGVPEGSTVTLELRFEAIMEGVLATGTASAQVTGECVRCLDEIGEDLTIDLQELFYFEGATEDDFAVEDDMLDLEPPLREAVLLALPRDPWCGPDCPGLCPECGARLADDPEHTHGEAIDPRWASLSQLTDTEPEE